METGDHKQKILVSFSGGRTSAFMTWWLLHHPGNRELCVVFANTGKEREETLEFVRQCDEQLHFGTTWVEAVTDPVHGHGVRARVVNFQSASRKGEPFEAMIAKHGIPNRNAPFCTKELKTYAIRAYARSIGWTDYHTAIGIRIDEPRRLNFSQAKEGNIWYPLATTRPTWKADIDAFWKTQPFNLQLKSYEGNCDACWKKSLRKLRTIAKENEHLFDWWKEMETKYGNHIPATRNAKGKIKTPIHFFREDHSAEDIVEDSRFDFEPAIDESGSSTRQLPLWHEYLDSSDGCTESCEIV